MKPEMVTVSAVIPTRNRPDLVLRAAQSVLSQTYSAIEAIVVIDGPDLQTEEALRAVSDPRLRVIALAENAGGSEARNIGVRAARGEWVALLDDDDIWLPEKIAVQMAEVARFAGGDVCLGCQYTDRREEGDVVQPSKMIRPGQPISEYLFCEVPLMGYREGFLQTSTWLVSKELMLRVPFTKGLKRNQDTDWLLHAISPGKVQIGIVPQVLAVFDNHLRSDRVSSVPDWKGRYAWAKSNRRYFTAKAFSFFIATECVPLVIKTGPGEWRHLFSLLWDVFTVGAPVPMALWLFGRNAILLPVSRVLFPKSLRKGALRAFGGGKPSSTAGSAN